MYTLNTVIFHSDVRHVTTECTFQTNPFFLLLRITQLFLCRYEVGTGLRPRIWLGDKEEEEYLQSLRVYNVYGG